MIMWGKLLTYSRDMIDESCVSTKLGGILKSRTEERSWRI
jgi:hypothetical protein